MTDGNKKERLREAFKNAVEKFWVTMEKFDVDTGNFERRTDLIDAADRVLLARDDLYGSEEDKARRAAVAHDVLDVKYYLEKHDIRLGATAQTTGTGRTTYRILNKPSRFDA
jgi:hypothetical protein